MASSSFNGSRSVSHHADEKQSNNNNNNSNSNSNNGHGGFPYDLNSNAPVYRALQPLQPLQLGIDGFIGPDASFHSQFLPAESLQTPEIYRSVGADSHPVEIEQRISSLWPGSHGSSSAEQQQQQHQSSGSGKKGLNADSFLMSATMSLSMLGYQQPAASTHLEEQLIQPRLESLSLNSPSSLQQDACFDLEPPAPKGGFVEEGSSLALSPHCKPRDVFLAVMCFLREKNLDCVPKEEKFKLCCATYVGHEKTFFKCRIFALPVKRYLLEFQRRSGNAVLFYDLFRETARFLQQQHMLADDAVVPSPPPGSPLSVQPLPLSLRDDALAPPSLTAPPSPVASPADLDPSKAKGAVRSLCEMGKSPYRDVRRQALRSLASFSSDTGLQKVLREEGAFDIFVAALSAECEDANRCAISGLANLAKSQEISCRQLVQQGCVRHLLSTVRQKGGNGGTKGFTPQVVREIARLLVNVREKLGREILPRCDKVDAQAECVAEAREALHSLMCSSDPVVRQHADTLHDVLGGVDLVHTGVAGGYGRFVPV